MNNADEAEEGLRLVADICLKAGVPDWYTGPHDAVAQIVEQRDAAREQSAHDKEELTACITEYSNAREEMRQERWKWYKTSEALREQVRRLREALETIKRDYGHVCAKFETCSHAACRDSYSAWEVARAALAASEQEGK